MRKTFVAFNQSDGSELGTIAKNPVMLRAPGKESVERPIAMTMLARADSEIAAAIDGQLVSGDVTLQKFSPGSSPATMTASGMATVTAWNPHDEAIPADTYLILGKTPYGWVIIQPLNYCP